MSYFNASHYGDESLTYFFSSARVNNGVPTSPCSPPPDRSSSRRRLCELPSLRPVPLARALEGSAESGLPLPTCPPGSDAHGWPACTHPRLHARASCQPSLSPSLLPSACEPRQAGAAGRGIPESRQFRRDKHVSSSSSSHSSVLSWGCCRCLCVLLSPRPLIKPVIERSQALVHFPVHCCDRHERRHLGAVRA